MFTMYYLPIFKFYVTSPIPPSIIVGCALSILLKVLGMIITPSLFRNFRAIFERAIQKNFKPKVMKTVFRKYVEFEGKYGTEKSVIEVKEKAMEFVKGLARKEKNDE